MRRFGWNGLGLGVLAVAGSVLSGCGDELGTCNEEQALRVVYDEDGYPYAEGQALAHASCGQGGFCHSAGAQGEARVGAPAGLNFDLRTLPADASDAELRRVRRGRLELLNWAEESYALVVDGEMPPGEVGEMRVLQTTWAREENWPSEAEPENDDLPSIHSSAGQEIFRNWLACGADSFEQPRADFPRLEEQGPGLQPTWDSIYAEVVNDGCASQSCHVAGSGYNGGLLLGDRCASLSNLIGQSAPAAASGTDSCTMNDGVLIEPGNAGASLFYTKLLPATPCGSQMPITGNKLDEPTRAIIQQWIDDGAQAPADCM